jgi:hypothetical protein
MPNTALNLGGPTPMPQHAGAPQESAVWQPALREIDVKSR